MIDRHFVAQAGAVEAKVSVPELEDEELEEEEPEEEELFFFGLDRQGSEICRFRTYPFVDR